MHGTIKVNRNMLIISGVYVTYINSYDETLNMFRTACLNTHTHRHRHTHTQRRTHSVNYMDQ